MPYIANITATAMPRTAVRLMPRIAIPANEVTLVGRLVSPIVPFSLFIKLSASKCARYTRRAHPLRRGLPAATMSSSVTSRNRPGTSQNAITPFMIYDEHAVYA